MSGLRNDVFIVAELSANHLGDYERAKVLVRAARLAGADAVKLQTWTPDSMVLDRSLVVDFGPWKGQRMAALYDACFTPWEWHEPLKRWAEQLGCELFSAAFDLKALAFLESIGVRRHKIASFELIDTQLVRAAAYTGKPLILSTGMATAAEIETALGAAEEFCSDLTLLRCTSAYPAPLHEAGLRALPHLRTVYACKVGLSDHTEGMAVAAGAVALGATYIEKHLTLSRADGGPDASFSLEPHEFADMARLCRQVHEALGPGRPVLRPSPSEAGARAMRRSLWWSQDLPAGHTVRELDLVSARPALGAHPHALRSIVGANLKRAVRRHTPVLVGDDC